MPGDVTNSQRREARCRGSQDAALVSWRALNISGFAKLRRWAKEVRTPDRAQGESQQSLASLRSRVEAAAVLSLSENPFAVDQAVVLGP